MARMWPEVLPLWVSSDPRRSTEVEVFGRLRDKLTDAWEVFYSRPWWGINAKGGEIDGEADFILAHPDKGFLFLEVKGGRVKFDPATSQWTSKDRNGITHNIKDPINQALVCKHRYIVRLKKTLGWPNGYIRFRHGAVLPDSSENGAENLTIGGYERSLFCLSGEFEDFFAAWIEERLAIHASESSSAECPPGTVAVDILRTLVADPTKLHVPLRRILDAEGAQLENLVTGQQLHLITLLDNFPVAVIEGGAGTGKTLLALEMAVRSAESGKRVCLTCYNNPIAEWMKERIADYPLITAGTFHSICGKIVSSSGMACHGHSKEFYDHELPLAALSVLEKKESARWDVVLVDEGQDFLEDWWQVVEHMFPDKNSAVIRVFYDSNQSLYRKSSDIALMLSAQSFPLRHNLRNTKAISRITDSLYKGPQIFAVGPDGESPKVFGLNYSDSCNAARDLVVRFVREENVVLGEIAVLMSGEAEASKFRSDLESLQIRSVAADRLNRDAITVDTIKRFKGLESLIVVLVINSYMAKDLETAYVAVSRAKTRLYIFGSITGTLLEKALIEGGAILE